MNPSRLLLNGLTFAALGLAAQAQAPWTPSAPVDAARIWWSDYDGDGDVDAFVLHPAEGVRLLAGFGDGTFQDVTARVGLAELDGVSQALWRDVDGDGRPELYVVAARGASRLFRFERESFVDVTAAAGLGPGVGVRHGEWLDVDADGLDDLHLSTARGELVMRNLGGVRFEELDLGVAPVDVRWSRELTAWIEDGRARTALESAGEDQGLPATSGVSSTGVGSAPGRGMASGSPFCWDTLEDQATGNCLTASSIPTVGALFPLGPQFNIDGAGRVGIGTLSPGAALDVVGSVRASGQLIATATSGAPLAVSSTGQVTNLNADLLDGLHASAFSQLGSTIENSELANDSVNSAKIQDDSVTSLDIGPNAVGTSELATNSVGAAEIAAAAVGSSEIANDSITSADIGPDAVGSSEIAAGAVGASELASGAVSNVDVSASAAIQGTKIAPNFGSQSIVTTGNVGAGTTTPATDLHVLGNATRGIALIAPDQPTDGGNAELFLAEDDDGTTGMRIKYDGAGNVLRISGKNAGETTHFELTRDQGRAGLGRAPVSNARFVLEGLSTDLDAFHCEQTSSNPVATAIFAAGNFAANGVKLFVQPHPADASKEVRFVCLEGNESGTYFRGTARLIGGEATIEVPEDFRLVSEAEHLTVQTTPLGAPAVLYVASKDLDRIVVRGTADVEFDYFVSGVRRGFGGFQTIVENTSFVPEVRGVEWATQYPDAVRRILVEDGTLNPDFTPNEATAAALGWQLVEAAD